MIIAVFKICTIQITEKMLTFVQIKNNNRKILEIFQKIK